MIIYIQALIALCLGIVSSISDFRNKKIYNKYIIISIIASIMTYVFFFKQIDRIYIKNFAINFIISCLVSFAFFYFKIWAAGDAKLFIAIIFMIPFELYEVSLRNYFPGLYVLIYVFSIAFIYVLLETIVLFVGDKNKFEGIKKYFVNVKHNVGNGCIDFLMGYSFILTINNCLSIFVNDFYNNNGELLFISNTLILLFVYRLIKARKNRIIVLIISSIVNIIHICITGIFKYSVNSVFMLVIIIIIIFRNISEKYNYKTIDVKDLKERMILSYGSVLSFYGSRVKGLPHYTDESTDSRLSETEVESIKRWSNTSKGMNTITIVRHMPFAPFILAGEILFFVSRVLL